MTGPHGRPCIKCKRFFQLPLGRNLSSSFGPQPISINSVRIASSATLGVIIFIASPLGETFILSQRSERSVEHLGRYSPARRLHRRSRLRARLLPASDHRFCRSPLGVVGAGCFRRSGLSHRHPGLHGVVCNRLRLNWLRSNLARWAAADCPECRAICARNGVPLRSRSSQ